MKFSEKWLREWVNPEVNQQELLEQLTMAGLEVDGLEPAANDFTLVVVGQILSVEKHPNADKLNVCQVNNGSETLQVVCGASNVRPGLKIPYALIGAKLAPDFKIKKAKLRGIESLGMLCGADELGLAETSAGLLELNDDAPVGTDIREYLGLDDTIIEVDLTPNRGDCLSLLGLAREVGVLNKASVKALEIPPVADAISDQLNIKLSSPTDCPRYLGRIIRNVKVDAQTPLWMQEKLRRSGIRSIDPIVDITNYVLIELGQPMHAFDLDAIDPTGIDVRQSHKGEKLTLLDGKEIKLSPGTLVIADKQKALAIAGVMGGQDSAVSTTTKNIFLESAFFNPITIAGKARAYGLQTDAAHRYERGVDYNMPRSALERATQLLLDIVGGEAGPISEQTESLPESNIVELRAERIQSLLGIAIDNAEVTDILTRLGLTVTELSPTSWQVIVPSFRFDISIEADLIEELARIYGYNNLPVTEPLSRFSLKQNTESKIGIKSLRPVLTTLGYQEVITYSFVEPELESAISLENNTPITLANPISQDMSVMRSSLWSGLLKTLKHNQNRQQDRVRLFESGLIFSKTSNDIEQNGKIGGVIWGPQLPQQWAGSTTNVDFFDCKGDVEALLASTRDAQSFSFVAAQHPALQEGQSAEILRHEQSVGFLGALNPALQRKLDIPGKVFLFELDLTRLETASLPKVEALSKFPSVRRDLALIVSQELEFSAINKVINTYGDGLLVDSVVFDVFDGQNIEKGKKSLALGLTFQHPSRSLVDDEINTIIDSCIKALEAQFNAELRN